MGQPVVHFEVVGRDGDKLREFFSGMFDWKISADNPQNYGIVDAADNGGVGIGGGVAGYAEGPDHVTFYVQVDDVEATLQKAEQLGGKRVMGPDEIPGMLILGQLEDPEGHKIGVMTPLGDGQG